MKSPLLLSILSLLLLATAVPEAQARGTRSSQPRYIIKLKPMANQRQFTQALTKLLGSPRSIHHEYSIGRGFQGYSVTITNATIAGQLKQNPHVSSIRPDSQVTIRAVQDNPPSWGLARISQERKAPGPFTYPDSAGEDVPIYVLDSGIAVGHPDFEGRATVGWKANPEWNDNDENGHGTFVAAIAMGRQYGVSKLAKAISVKTVGSDGNAYTSELIAGLNFVAKEAQRLQRTVIANASVGSDVDDDVNAAAVAAIQAGVVVVTAAGNSQRDACLESPGAVPGVLTVAASSDRDRLEYVSNWGHCVDLVAPGTSIMSASKDGGSEIRTGTSFAAPHVAGAAALLLAENPQLTPKQVAEKLTEKATRGVLDRKGLRGTPNVLLHV